VSLTLPALCEPLFQYVCRISRSSRRGVPVEAAQVRADLRTLIDELSARAGEDATLKEKFAGVHAPLVAFVDGVMPGVVGASSWTPLADELGMENADSDGFYWAVDNALRAKGPGSDGGVEGLHTCLGLGYRGERTGREAATMLERTTERLGARVERDPSARVCPAAYDHVNTSDLIQPAGRSVVGIVVVLAFLLLVVVIGNAVIYRSASSELSGALDAIARALGTGG